MPRAGSFPPVLHNDERLEVMLFNVEGIVTGVKYLLNQRLCVVVLRGGAVALESSGMPTVPNNLRSQTLDRSSTPSDNRRVRVSN